MLLLQANTPEWVSLGMQFAGVVVVAGVLVVSIIMYRRNKDRDD